MHFYFTIFLEIFQSLRQNYSVNIITLETPEKPNGPVGTDGKPIDALPNTGSPLFIIAGAVIALAVVALVVKKIRK